MKIGDVLHDHYEILDELGQGGFGRVLLARHTAMDRRVAVKVLQLDKIDDAGLRDTMRKRFLQEAQIISRLHHPNTVQVFDFGTTDDDEMYMVVEYIEGMALDELVSAHGRMAPDRVAHVLKQLLGSLDEAHGEGIVHRDIKPANVMVMERLGDPWFVKVLDFGIAAGLPIPDAATVEGLTMTGAIIGTPGHMSPEQLCGQQATEASDVYCVGLLAFELLVGDPAYTSEVTAPSLSEQAFGPDLHLPKTLDMPDALRDAIHAALLKDVEKRLPTAQAFLDALEGIDTAPAEAPEPPTQMLPPVTADTVEIDAASAAAVDLPSKLAEATADTPAAPPRSTFTESSPVEPPSSDAPDPRKYAVPILSALLALSVLGLIVGIVVWGPNGPDKPKPKAVIGGTPEGATDTAPKLDRSALSAMYLAASEPEPPVDCRATSQSEIGLIAKAASALEDGKPRGQRPEDKAALELLQSAPPESRGSAEFDAWLVRARLFATTDMAATGTAAEAAVLKCPKSAMAHKLLGDVHLLSARRSEAIDAYDAAIELTPEYGAAHYNLGLALLLSGDHARAVAVFGDLMAQDGGYEGVYSARSRAFSFLGEHDKALADADKAIDEDPKDGMAHWVRGISLTKLDRGAEASPSFCRALELGVAQARGGCKTP